MNKRCEIEMTYRAQRRVSYIFPISHKFRAPFHEIVKTELLRYNIVYNVVYSPPLVSNASRGDTVAIPWGTSVRSLRLVKKKLIYQMALKEALGSQLVILQQENSLLLNYLLQAFPRRLRPKIAFFGHGRNFQARSPDGLAERWKRFWAVRCNWWFGYTDETRHHIASLGFPCEKITVFNNSIDTVELQNQLSAVTLSDTEQKRRDLGLVGFNVCIYIGGFYDEKRLPFLIEAAELIRAEISDFELVLVGGGPAALLVRELARRHSWIKVTGPAFDQEKAALLTLGELFLMPGLVGLGVLDAGVAGLPLVTTAYPYHSPEIAYLKNGFNGLIISEWQSPLAYAAGVIVLLKDHRRREELSRNARQSASRYTVESMALRFVAGVRGALGDTAN